MDPKLIFNFKVEILRLCDYAIKFTSLKIENLFYLKRYRSASTRDTHVVALAGDL